MKAVVLHEYGGPQKLRYEDFPDPVAGPGEVLVKVHASSVNPIDWKLRSGAAKDRFPMTLPTILGRDLSGTVLALGEGVSGFVVGEKVFALAWRAYAELCVVKAQDLARMPDGLDPTTAASIPLVALTGDQLIHVAAEAQAGQTILLTGALGSVGRCALYCAVQMGVKVIAGVRRKQQDEAIALGAIGAVDIDDDGSLARLGWLDAVADTVGGALGAKFLSKVKPGGLYGTVVGPPKDAEYHPTAKVNAIMAHADIATIVAYGEAVRDGKLKLPIGRVMPLCEADEAQSEAERGGCGKIVLLA